MPICLCWNLAGFCWLCCLKKETHFTLETMMDTCKASLEWYVSTFLKPGNGSQPFDGPPPDVGHLGPKDGSPVVSSKGHVPNNRVWPLNGLSPDVGASGTEDVAAGVGKKPAAQPNSPAPNNGVRLLDGPKSQRRTLKPTNKKDNLAKTLSTMV